MKLSSIFQQVSTFLGFALMLCVSLISVAKEVNQSIPVQQNESIEIVAKQGVFSITGWNKDFVALTGEANDDVQIERVNSKLILKLDSESSTSSDNLDIKIPNGKRINVVNDDADFSFNSLNSKAVIEVGEAKNFDSDIVVTSVDGNVRVIDSSGDFNIQTVNGDIEILNSKGGANIRTVSGTQDVNADFRTVSSSNVSGQSSYTLRTLDKLNLSNVNGDTVIKSAVSQGASIQIQSVKGNVELLVPKSTSARFALQSHQGGTIHNTLNVQADAEHNSDGAHVFALADASASVTINTMDGNISVAYQKENVSDYDDENFDWSSVDTSLLNFAFVNPKYNVFDYQEIFIKEPEIRFDSSWEKKYGKGEIGIYQQRIATEYANLLKAAIRDNFAKTKRFKVVEQRKENVLVIIPKVLDLYITNPETIEFKEVLTAARAGNASIDLVVFSPSDNSMLALFMDKRSTSRPGGLPIPSSRIRNSRAFSRLFNDWIEDMVKVLSK